MKSFVLALVLGLSLLAPTQPATAMMSVGCGSACWAQIQGYCPSCAAAQMASMMPWGAPQPWWWGPGSLAFANFRTPGPWSYVPGYPGVVGPYYPGGGQVFAAKPNLYLHAPEGTKFEVKLKTEAVSNFQWLSTVPSHGNQGWSGQMIGKDRLRVGDVTYGFLYSDYRMDQAPLQDQSGFCVVRENLVQKLAMNLKTAGFDEREIADFLDFWSVKIPPAKRFCVYPQDETVLNEAAPYEIKPAPVALRRLIFLVQVDDGLLEDGTKFSYAPKKDWSPLPMPQRMPASGPSIVAREWGVAFLAARDPHSVQQKH